MATVLDKSNCQSPAGWIDHDDGGIIEYNQPQAGQRACELIRVGDASWDTLGNERRRKQTGVAGMILSLDYYFAGAATDFLFGFRRSAGLGLSSTTGIYNNGSGGLWMIENGNTPGSDAAPANVSWIRTKAVFNADGTITFSWTSDLNPVWTEIGTTTATDWLGAECHFSTNCYRNQPAVNSFIDNLLWTKP